MSLTFLHICKIGDLCKRHPPGPLVNYFNQTKIELVTEFLDGGVDVEVWLKLGDTFGNGQHVSLTLSMLNTKTIRQKMQIIIIALLGHTANPSLCYLF